MPRSDGAKGTLVALAVRLLSQLALFHARLRHSDVQGLSQLCDCCLKPAFRNRTSALGTRFLSAHQHHV